MVTFVLLVIAILAAAIAAFSLYNSDPVTVKFFVWKVEEVPLAAVILAAVLGGAIPVSLIGFVGRLRLKLRIRQLESRVRELEAPKRES